VLILKKISGALTFKIPLVSTLDTTTKTFKLPQKHTRAIRKKTAKSACNAVHKMQRNITLQCNKNKENDLSYTSLVYSAESK